MPATETLRPPETEPPAHPKPQSWWRFGIVWLTLGLPAAAVVGSVLSAVLAWRYIDPVVVDAPAVSSAAPPAADAPRANALEPAQRARNHAATPRP